VQAQGPRRVVGIPSVASMPKSGVVAVYQRRACRNFRLAAVRTTGVSDENISTVQSSGRGSSFNRGSLPGPVGLGGVSKKRSDLNLLSGEGVDEHRGFSDRNCSASPG
jgi:hypothetical protein